MPERWLEFTGDDTWLVKFNVPKLGTTTKGERNEISFAACIEGSIKNDKCTAVRETSCIMHDFKKGITANPRKLMAIERIASNFYGPDHDARNNVVLRLDTKEIANTFLFLLRCYQH